MVQGASFSTSAIRAYTGDTGPTGNSYIGATGPVGATGAAAPSTLAPTGPTGSTGEFSLSTIYEDGRYKLVFTSATGESITLIPRDSQGRVGLTGIAGPVTGTFATFENFVVAGGATLLADVSNGTLVLPGTEEYSSVGVSGSTLEFRRIGVAGDFVFYTDETQKIGAGATYHILGISGPVADVNFGTVNAQSIGEIAILQTPRDTIDGHGLTFTENTTTIPPGLPSGGTTWGTLFTNMYVNSNHVNVYGSVDTGVLTDPFYVNNTTANTHIIYAPFHLSGITFEQNYFTKTISLDNNVKRPVSVLPAWFLKGVRSPYYEGLEIPEELTGYTADHGEMSTATLLINVKNSPEEVSFNPFYFYWDPNNNTLSPGMNIVNCFSLDHGLTWFCSVTGKYYRLNDTGDDAVLYGACCNSVEGTPNYLDCDDFITKQECDLKADDGYEFYLETSCSETPCNVGGAIGSCCINKDSYGETNCIDTGNLPGGIVLTRELCEKYGGNFRPLTPCGSEFPCGNPCNDDFGERGACCEFTEDGSYVACYDDFGIEECIAKGEEVDGYTSYNGNNSYCATTDCCAGEAQFGACCGVGGDCVRTTAKICAEQNGFYQGNGTLCENVVCTCDPTIPPPDAPGGGPGPGPDGPEPPVLGACCGVNGNCIEQVYDADCPAGYSHYPNLTCQLACPELPPPPPPLGKCCKGPSTCTKCSTHTFQCNDISVLGPNSKWLSSVDVDGSRFGGFPFCECNDNDGLGMSEAACYALFGPDAHWTGRSSGADQSPLTEAERCKVTNVGGASPFIHCGDYEENIGKCCTGNNTSSGCECLSCLSRSECAAELLTDGNCPPSPYTCDISGWAEYMRANPGKYHIPATPYGFTPESCGGCPDTSGSSTANCSTCAPATEGSGGDDCGCNFDPPIDVVGCITVSYLGSGPCPPGFEGDEAYWITTQCCQPASEGCPPGDIVVQVPGCAEGGECSNAINAEMLVITSALGVGPGPNSQGQGNYSNDCRESETDITGL